MVIFRSYRIFLLPLLWLSYNSSGQVQKELSAQAKVDFSQKIRDWDGFGFNYVETAQTFDYQKQPQDYGGFKFLKEEDKKKIIAMVFGEDGLKVGLVKMFLDPLHQKTEGGKFDHQYTTANMRYFVKEGLRTTRARGADFEIITTMYGPPGFITKQKVIRGRDLDPAQKDNLCMYLVDWALYLKEKEQLPVKYVSLHNEGEDWYRWPADGTVGTMQEAGHDYNFFWPATQVAEIIPLLRKKLDAAGLKDVGVTNGEFTNWYRFNAWGYAGEIEKSQEALKNLALITSHGFYAGSTSAGHWFAPHSSSGIDRLQDKKPTLHAWTTSTSWNTFLDTKPRKYYTDAQFIKEIHNAILDAKLNGLIPWAGIQNATQWYKPDPNPGTAIRVYDDGTYEINKAYYYYKQVSRAGQRGMAVAESSVMSSELSIFAFGANGTRNANAFIVINLADSPRKINVDIKGENRKYFHAFRTSGRQMYDIKQTAQHLPLEGDNYLDIGKIEMKNGQLTYEAPAGSVTTFFAAD